MSTRTRRGDDGLMKDLAVFVPDFQWPNNNRVSIVLNETLKTHSKRLLPCGLPREGGGEEV